MVKCLVRGSINADEYFHVKAISRPGETISSSNFSTKPGGKGANQAVAVSKAGGSVEFVGAVGPGGQWLVQELVNHGVGVQHMLNVLEPTGRALIQVAEDGENSIVLHHGANYAELPTPSPETFNGVTHLLLQNEIPLKSTIEYLSLAHSQNVISVMNPSPMPSEEDIQAFPWQNLSWLIVNEGEASALLNALGSSVSSINQIPDGWPQDPSICSAYSTAQNLAHQKLFASRVNIICTLGPQGVLALLPSLAEPIYLPAAKLRGAVIDTTGAGDCFTGYLVAGLMELHQKGELLEIGGAAQAGKALSITDVVGVLKRCIQASGMCVQQRGTIDSIPKNDEVDAYPAF